MVGRAFAALLLSLTVVRAAEPFTFAAMGCMPYSLPGSAPDFERLIQEVNRHHPVFSVHCGDIKAGAEPSSQEHLERIHSFFMRFEGPIIYTPGDNEWTDVHREDAGGHDPLHWLAKLRARFFADESSLGQHPIPLITQRRDPDHSEYVENARWSHGGVVFATLHIVGSNNNLQPKVPGAVEEHERRDSANIAWTRAAFAQARESDALGLVLFFQADPIARDYGRAGRDSGFVNWLAVLEEECRSYHRPILLVHADEHRFRLEHGLKIDAETEPLPHVSRLGLFGANDLHAALVVVHPDNPDLFLASPLIVPGNKLPGLWSNQLATPRPAAP